MSKLELTYQTYSLLSVPKIHTDLLWDLSILFGSLGLLYFGIIFYFRNKTSKRKRTDLERRKKLAPNISNFLFFEEDSSKEEQNEYIDLKVQIREYIKDPQNKRVLKEILIDLQKDLTGDSRKKLFKLYQDYDLHLDAYNNLKSWRWQIISKGIQELTQMQVEEAYTFIKKFINDPRGVIRKQAQIATVSLKHEGISHFLDTNRYHISEWQQIKILEVLQNLEDFIPPKFGSWLTSKNKDVVLFALRLIKYYNQIDSNISIIELVKHKDDEVKQAAIHCIKEFGIANATGVLKVSLRKCSTETKIMILDTIGYLGKKEDLDFLYRAYNQETNFNVRSKALSAINAITPDAILPKENLDTSIKIEDPIDMPEVNEEIPAAPKELEEPIEVTEDNTLKPDTDDPQEDEANTFEIAALNQEDLDIFEICFMEELNELLSEPPQTDESINYCEYLPLDFLPLVEQITTTAMTKKKNQTSSNQAARNLDVIFEHVDPDENFRKELEDILSRIEIPDADGNIEVEYMNFKFLPFVVNGESQQDGIDELNDNNFLDLDVIYDEVALTEASKDFLLENEATVIDQDTCLLVDWNKVSEEQTTQEETKEENPNQELELKESYGFSIFEELFRSCDTESKLILMDEIITIGDEKEVHFLRSLFQDKNTQVRKKATEIEALLVKRLENELSEVNRSESYVKWTSDAWNNTLFDIHFELDSNKKIDKPQDKRSE